jgi:hypothetical protein
MNYIKRKTSEERKRAGSNTETLTERNKEEDFDMRHPVVTLRYKAEYSGFDSHGVIEIPAALWFWVNSSPNRNEYQWYLLGVKAASA